MTRTLRGAMGALAAMITLTCTLAACGSSDTAGASDPSPSESSTAVSPSTSTIAPPAGSPFGTRQLYVWPDAKAAQAAASMTGADAALVSRIAATPTAIWLTPEVLPADTVGDFVSTVVRSAGEALPIFVVYGLPDRDCTGGHSAGGLDANDYLAWVRALAQGMSQSPVVIVEPDALASAADCGLVSQREELLSTVIGTLAPVASVYVDAGHANWVPAATMAQMLSATGIERARGFAVNVSAYDTDASERAYADQVSAQLGGAHYVIDSSRNGAGGTTEWCNPSGQALGLIPAASTDGTALDAHLWIKPPGESDGTCNGGPPAGTFWPARAVELARNAGWN